MNATRVYSFMKTLLLALVLCATSVVGQTIPVTLHVDAPGEMSTSETNAEHPVAIPITGLVPLNAQPLHWSPWWLLLGVAVVGILIWVWRR